RSKLFATSGEWSSRRFWTAGRAEKRVVFSTACNSGMAPGYAEPSARRPGSDLLAELRPVLQELLEADVGQRMLHELLEHRERDRHDVGAGLRGVDHVERVTDRRGEHLGLEALDAVDLADVADEVHADVGNVVEASEERTDIDGARLRREEGLGRREAERLVDADPLAGEILHGLEAVLGEGALDDGVRRDLRQLLAFLHHALEVRGHHLEAHIAGNDRADLLDQRPEWTLLLGDQRGVGGDAVDDTERHAFLDLAEVRRVQEDLHGALLRNRIIRNRIIVARSSRALHHTQPRLRFRRVSRKPAGWRRGRSTGAAGRGGTRS